ncbi:type I-E CRISPR-associated protein Cse1/CasA [Azohydromonas australica]|uniref:type I-E CRISPR-associated protein Cse1/CasA n=1 Tax=Azohydromonas australica TaxID=364039 RepID=UPI00042331CD|nr:type I-E CRISPR-associated protein Cse1/CasA [Azohydromonas australica]
MSAPPTAGGDAAAPAFNLLDEPWIPVRLASGQVTELGLLELFRQASGIEALAEPAPPSLVALHRILLAISHRALTCGQGRWSHKDRAHWYEHGLPADVFTGYLEQWRDRFWLFHPELPFMQVAALATAEETRDKLKPWTQVALDRASGNTPVVFDHGVDTQPPTVDAGLVLRHLLGFLQFTPGGLVKVFRGSDKAGPLSNTAAVLPLGGCLAQTLLLGLHPAPTDARHDLPAWERPAPTLAELRADARPSSGCCDRYSRLSRAVLLLREPGDARPLVRWIRFGAGLALLEDENAPDPMASQRAGSNGMVRVTFSEGRATWRDLGALLPDGSGTQARQAAVLGWADTLLDKLGQGDAKVPVIVAGLCSDQAKLLRWRMERYRLPANALHSEQAAEQVRDQLKRCEELFYQVRNVATAMFALTMPDAGSKDTRARARAVLDAGPFATAYFSVAERALPALLDAIAAGDFGAAHAQWSAVLLGAARGAWNSARLTLGYSVAALRAEASTRGRFEFLLKDLKPAPADQNRTEEPTT